LRALPLRRRALGAGDDHHSGRKHW
jgi:hypothetical protein